jgi:tetratricopeptide (TPR) repeat protein
MTVRSRLFAACLWIAMSAWSAPADDLREAQKLYQQGKIAPALEKTDAYLKGNPKEPQGRFLRGLLLTEQRRVPEAIQVFTALTEDYPELPEPYNNLAVLYASQGNYEKAKSALELAIHTHPSYATAHENLGDIYAQLASRAYDRALQLDKSNTTAQTKLALVKELFVAQKGAAAPSLAKAEPRTQPAAVPAKSEPKVEPPVTPAKAGAQAPESKPEPVAKATPPAPAPVSAPTKPATPAPATVASPPVATAPPAAPAGDAKAQITTALEAWARAWSSKDIPGYLGHYAPDFEVPGGATRAAWEKERTERIQKPKSIDVSIKVLSVQASGNEATAKVRQSYRSDTLKSDNTKTLRLVKSGDRWLIKQERVGG